MNPLNAADQALIAQLEKITLSNGYLTDIGTRIHSKWVGALLDDQATVYPCIALQPDESPAPLKGAGVWLFHLGRRVVAMADPAQVDDSLSLLNDIAADLARCLHVEEGVPNPWGNPGPRQVIVKTINQFLPDREVPVGTVSVPVLMHVILPGE
jgi:hypothetical protein